jgi:hypothetical protein
MSALFPSFSKEGCLGRGGVVMMVQRYTVEQQQIKIRRLVSEMMNRISLIVAI